MNTLYVTPSSSSASPSRAGSSTPGSSSPHAASPSGAATASRQAASVRRRRSIRPRILFGGPAHRRPRGVHPRRGPEARRLRRLIAGDRRPLELPLGRLLEDHPQPLERLLRLAPDPAGGADLPQPVDDLPRAVALPHRQLGVLLGQRAAKLKARRRPRPDRVHPCEPVVAHVVVRVRRAAGQVRHEVEDLLAGSGDDCGDADLAHGGAIVRGCRQAAFGTTASRRSPACTRSERTACLRSSGSAPKHSSHSTRPESSSCRRSPASGIRRHSPQPSLDGLSAPRLRRSSIAPRSGMVPSSAGRASVLQASYPTPDEYRPPDAGTRRSPRRPESPQIPQKRVERGPSLVTIRHPPPRGEIIKWKRSAPEPWRGPALSAATRVGSL